ncbi:MAG: DUF3052 family protein [Gemmatimonadota bacterium]|nr:DUF3052 family protein [Gemmatimonadota bacterium]
MRVRFLETPSHYEELLGGYVSSLELVELEPGGGGRADFTHLFATREVALRERLAIARDGMAEDGMVWVSWPKKSSGVESEVGRSEVMAEGEAAGLVDVKVCAVDETWSGLKFVIPVEDREETGRGA